MSNPLDGISVKAINLHEEGKATNKVGFVIKTEEEKRDLRPINVQLGIDENTILSADPILKSKVIKLVNKHSKFWAHFNNNKLYGVTQDLEFQVELFDSETRPIKQRFRILNELQVKSLENQLSEWLKYGIITKHSVLPNGSWCSAFVPVLKSHKGAAPSLRWTSDFRQLNEKTKPLIVCLPVIEDNLLLLSGAKYFSAVDFSQGYFHLKVAQDSLKYMYQAAPNFYVRYEYMPQGLRNAGAYFTLWVRKLHERLPKHLAKYIVVYLDDLLVATPTLELHFSVLEPLFPILENAGVILNSPKSEIFRTEIEYLGFSVTHNKISVKQSYLGKIKSWPQPVNLKNLESFLGFLGYYSSLIPYFSERVFNISELRRKVRNGKEAFLWTKTHDMEFEDLKQALLSSPCRGFAIYDFQNNPKVSPLILSTDFFKIWFFSNIFTNTLWA